MLEEREAAEIQRQRGELAATLLASLSHDLKTPLTGPRRRRKSPRRSARHSRRAQADAAISELSRLTRLFEDILDMARIDAAAARCSASGSPLPTSSTRQWHMRGTRSTGMRCASTPTPSTSVNVDARLAAVALSHLLENAARYSPADRDIVVDARAGADGVPCPVTDRGPGLDPAEIDHLFERFYRGPPRAADRAGHRHGAGDRERSADSDRRQGVG